MGDIADLYIDYFDRWGEDDEPGDTPVKCNRCGKACTWHDTGVRWALMGNNGRLHNCATASPDEFAVLPDFDPNDPAQGLG